MTIQSVKTGTQTTLDQLSYTTINSLSLTPGAGTWLVIYTIELQTPSTPTTGETITIRIRKNSVAQGASLRNMWQYVNFNVYTQGMVDCAIVTTDADDVIDVAYQVSNPSVPFYGNHRELICFPIYDYYEEVYYMSASGKSNETFGDVTGVSLTPPAGNYLAIYAGQCYFNEAGAVGEWRAMSPTEVNYQTISQDSIGYLNTRWPLFMIWETSLNGSQEVKIQFRRIGPSGTVYTQNSALILIRIPSADVLTVTSTTVDSDSTTDDKQIDDMIITDPGAGDYLVMYSGDMYVGASISTFNTNFTFRSGGTTVTNTDKDWKIDGDQSYHNHDVCNVAKVTVASGTDDIQVYWQMLAGSQTRNADDRMLVAVRDQSYKIEGVTYDKNGSILGSVDCYLYRDLENNEIEFVAHVVSNATTGAYSFTGLGGESQYLVVFIKDGSPNVFDVTDHVLTGVAE